MTDLLVRHSENDKKALILLYGTPILEFASGLWYEQVLRVPTVSFVREIRQESLSVLHQFFLSDGMGSFVFSLTFSSEGLAPPIFS
jgi:hypothetical protein